MLEVEDDWPQLLKRPQHIIKPSNELLDAWCSHQI